MERIPDLRRRASFLGPAGRQVSRGAGGCPGSGVRSFGMGAPGDIWRMTGRPKYASAEPAMGKEARSMSLIRRHHAHLNDRPSFSPGPVVDPARAGMLSIVVPAKDEAD